MKSVIEIANLLSRFIAEHDNHVKEEDFFEATDNINNKSVANLIRQCDKAWCCASTPYGITDSEPRYNPDAIFEKYANWIIEEVSRK